jgi:hypothetical protein
MLDPPAVLSYEHALRPDKTFQIFLPDNQARDHLAVARVSTATHNFGRETARTLCGTRDWHLQPGDHGTGAAGSHRQVRGRLRGLEACR